MKNWRNSGEGGVKSLSLKVIADELDEMRRSIDRLHQMIVTATGQADRAADWSRQVFDVAERTRVTLDAVNKRFDDERATREAKLARRRLREAKLADQSYPANPMS